MSRCLQVLNDENFKRTTSLAWSDEKCKLDALSDFDRFAFVCENAELFIGNRALELLLSALLYDTGERIDICRDLPIDRERTKELWHRIFLSENAKENKLEISPKYEELLEEKCRELYRRSNEKPLNVLSIEDVLLSMKNDKTAFPNDTEEMAEILVERCKNSGADLLSVDFRDRKYIRPDAYHAEQIYKSFASDEIYKNTNDNEMLTLGVWLLCRAMMKSELSPCIYIKNSEGLKITLDLLTRLKIERPLTLCIEPRRLDCHVQCEIAAIAAEYPQSIRIRLLPDTTEQDFVRSTHTILHTLPIGMFW